MSQESEYKIGTTNRDTLDSDAHLLMKKNNNREARFHILARFISLKTVRNGHTLAGRLG